MTAGPTTTITGNVTKEPEFKVLPTGAMLARMSVAVTPRYLDGKTGKWTDMETLFFDVDVWGQLAENVANSISKGDRVTVLMEMVGDKWEHEGKTRYAIKYRAVTVAADLTWSTAKVQRMSRSSNGQTSTGDDAWETASPNRPATSTYWQTWRGCELRDPVPGVSPARSCRGAPPHPSFLTLKC